MRIRQGNGFCTVYEQGFTGFQHKGGRTGFDHGANGGGTRARHVKALVLLGFSCFGHYGAAAAGIDAEHAADRAMIALFRAA